MAKSLANFDSGTICSSWNYSGQRLATGSLDGAVSIFDFPHPSSSSLTRTFKFKVNDSGIVKVFWVPPEYGDAIACIFSDGTFSLWEEIVEDSQPLQWKLCKFFKNDSSHVLDIQFGISSTLKMVVAFSNGYVKVFEVMDPLELKHWKIQAEFQNVSDPVSTFGKVACLSASISWNPLRGENLDSFILGVNSTTPQLNSAKVWEFDEAHQRWLPVAELALPEDKGDPVNVVAWAPNIGRPYELIAIATQKGISIWHLGMSPDANGRLSTERIAMLSEHGDEVLEMKWDMGGMTLASTGKDGLLRLWQCNLRGIWHEQASFEPTS